MGNLLRNGLGISEMPAEEIREIRTVLCLDFVVNIMSVIGRVTRFLTGFVSTAEPI